MLNQQNKDYFDQLPRMVKEMIWEFMPMHHLFPMRRVSSLWKFQIENFKGKNLRMRFDEFSKTGKYYQEKILQKFESTKQTWIEKYESRFSFVSNFINYITEKCENRKETATYVKKFFFFYF